MLVLAIAAAATPLAPVSKWNMRYEDDYCVLAQTYGNEAKPVTVGWRAIPLMDSIELVMTEPRNRTEFRRGKVAVDFDGRVTSGSFYSFPTNKAGLYMTRVTMDRASFSGSDKPVVVTVKPQLGHKVSFTVMNSAAAFKSLQTCINDTAKMWGVDPAAEAAIATPAKGVEGSGEWITAEDYPEGEARAGQQGISVLLWTIGTSGRVTECRAAIPSGSAVLDKAGCDALMKRGRYTPARDAAGTPVPSHAVRKIVWATPGGLARR